MAAATKWRPFNAEFSQSQFSRSKQTPKTLPQKRFADILMFAFGEGAAKRTLSGVIFGVGMAVGAVSFMSWLFPQDQAFTNEVQR